jgi:hypothetical protein
MNVQVNPFSNSQSVSRVLIALGVATLLAACSGSGIDDTAASSPNAKILGVMNMDVNLYPVNKLVCSPLAPNQPSTNAQSGLKAKLYYLNSSQPRYEDVKSYINNGHASDQTLFLSDVDVPTRLFNLGFANEAGATVKDDSGNLLIEYFALRMQSILKLATVQNEGFYQIALLADDGAILSLQDNNGNLSTYLNNDGMHPTQMGCATTALDFTRNSRKPMQLDYYQGPRYHIAMVMMMRRVDSATAALDPLCGQVGNELFYDYNNSSMPQPALQQLMSRGWEVLTPDNFLIPSDSQFNPCKEGDIPLISNFVNLENTGTTITMSWTTDLPSTSQLSFQEVAGGDTLLTTADNTLMTAHSVTITGLKHAQSYNVQAVSITASYGKGSSAIVVATTSR